MIGGCASFASFRVICPSRVGVRRAGPPLPQYSDCGGGRLASIIDQEGHTNQRQHHEEDDQKEVGRVQNPKHERWDAGALSRALLQCPAMGLRCGAVLPVPPSAGAMRSSSRDEQKAQDECGSRPHDAQELDQFLGFRPIVLFTPATLDRFQRHAAVSRHGK